MVFINAALYPVVRCFYSFDLLTLQFSWHFLFAGPGMTQAKCLVNANSAFIQKHLCYDLATISLNQSRP